MHSISYTNTLTDSSAKIDSLYHDKQDCGRMKFLNTNQQKIDKIENVDLQFQFIVCRSTAFNFNFLYILFFSICLIYSTYILSVICFHLFNSYCKFIYFLLFINCTLHIIPVVLFIISFSFPLYYFVMLLFAFIYMFYHFHFHLHCVKIYLHIIISLVSHLSLNN